jgi:hypothetical protein
MASYTTLQVCTAVANYKARSDHLSSGAVEAEWQDISYWRDVQLSPKSTATTAFNSSDGSTTSSTATATAADSNNTTSGASAHSRHARSSSFAFANSLTVSALLSQAQNCAEVCIYICIYFCYPLLWLTRLRVRVYITVHSVACLVISVVIVASSYLMRCKYTTFCLT